MLFAAGPMAINADWIALKPDSMINLSGNHPVPELVDEQAAAIASGDAPTFKPASPLIGNWQNADIYYPMSVVVDLQTKHQVRRIAYFDGMLSHKLAAE